MKEALLRSILNSLSKERSVSDGYDFLVSQNAISSLKRVPKLAKTVTDNNSPHSYPKMGVSKLHNAALPHLP